MDDPEIAGRTPDQKAAEKIGRAIDGQIFRLNEERATLLPAAASARVAEIDAELAVLVSEQSKISPRRPPKPVDATADTKVNSADVKPTR
jgi:hypothetical protein